MRPTQTHLGQLILAMLFSPNRENRSSNSLGIPFTERFLAGRVITPGTG